MSSKLYSDWWRRLVNAYVVKAFAVRLQCKSCVIHSWALQKWWGAIQMSYLYTKCHTFTFYLYTRDRTRTYRADPVSAGATDVRNDLLAGCGKRVRSSRLSTQRVQDLLQVRCVATQRYLAILNHSTQTTSPLDWLVLRKFVMSSDLRVVHCLWQH